MSKKALCNWKKSVVQKSTSQLADLLTEPSHFCIKCLRSASKKEALCKPQKISKICT